MKRTLPGISALVVSGFGLSLCGCASMAAVPVADVTADAGLEPIAISGYTTADGRHHAVDAKLHVVGDSLRFVITRTRPGFIDELEHTEFLLPRDQVVSVERYSVVRRTVKGVLVGGLALSAAYTVMFVAWLMSGAVR